jgi:hypothetical protein
MGQSHASGYGSRRRARIVRALLPTVASGGLLLLASLRVVYAGARLASSRVARADVVLVPGYRLERGEVGLFYDERLRRATRCGVATRAERCCSVVAVGATSGRPRRQAVSPTCDLGPPSGASVLLEPDALDTEQSLLFSVRRLAKRASMPLISFW